MPLWEIELEGGQIIELESTTEPTDEEVYAALKQPTQTATPQTNLGGLMAQWPQQSSQAYVPEGISPPSEEPVGTMEGLYTSARKGWSKLQQIPEVMQAVEATKRSDPTVRQERRAFESAMTDPAYFAALTTPGLKPGTVEQLYGPSSKLDRLMFPARMELSLLEQDIASERQRMADLPQSEAQIRLAQAKTQGEKFQAWLQNPIEITSGIFLESLPPSIAGAVAGALAGVPGVMAGIGLSSYATEFSTSLLEQAEQADYDTKDPERLHAFFNNDSVFRKAVKHATVRGAIVGGVDLATFGVSSGMVADALKEGFKRTLIQGAKGTLVEGAGGMTGEFLAQVATGEKIDPFEIAMEGVAEMLPFPAQVAASQVMDVAKQKGGERYAKGTGTEAQAQGRAEGVVEEAGGRVRVRDDAQGQKEAQPSAAESVMSVEDQIIELENDPQVTGSRLVSVDEAGNPVYEGVMVSERKKRQLQLLKDQAFGMAPAPTPVVEEAQPEFDLTEKQSNSAQTIWENATDEGRGSIAGEDRLDLVGAKWDDLTQEEKHYVALQTGAKRPKGGKQAVLQRMHVKPAQAAAAQITTEQDVENFVNELTTLRELRDRKAANSRQMGRLARMENVQGIGKLNAEDARYILRERLALEQQDVTVRGGAKPQIRISDEEDPTSPFSPARIQKGVGAAKADTFAVWDEKTKSILINAGRMANWRAGLRRIGFSEANILRAFQTMVAHEVLHGQTDPAAAEPFWASMTKVEQELFKRRYALDGPVPKMSDHLWGMEALAYRRAQAMSMTPIEFTQMTLNERIGWGTLDILERVFRGIRERLTTAGRLHLKILEQAFNNIRSAKEMVSRQESPSGPVRPTITEDNIDDLEEAQYRAMKHNDGIAYGVTLNDDDVPRLEKEYAKATEALPKAVASENDVAIFEAFGKLIFYGGAIQGASRGKSKIAAANYEEWLKDQQAMAETPSGPVRRVKTPKQTPEEIKAKYAAAMKLKAEGGAMTPEEQTALLTAPPGEVSFPKSLKPHQVEKIKSRFASKNIPFTAADIPQIVVNFVQEARDVSLSQFAKFFRETHGPVEEAQLRQTLKDNIGDALMQMPGSKLGDVLKEMGLVKQMFGGGTGAWALKALDKLPPLASQERKPRKAATGQMGLPLWAPQAKGEFLPAKWEYERAIVREMERRGYEQKGSPGIQTQKKAIAEIMHEIFFQTSDAAQGLFRKEISPEHMADPTKFANVFARIPRYQQKDTSMGEALSEKGRTSGHNVEDSKRLMVLRNDKTGKIDVVSIWNERSRRGVLVRSPTSTAESPVPYESALKTHSPIYTVLMYRPLRRFHKRYDNEADFMAAFGNEAKDIIQTTIAEEMPGEYQQTGLRPEERTFPEQGEGRRGTVTGVAMRAIPGEQMARPGMLGVRVGDIEANAGMGESSRAEEELAEAEAFLDQRVKQGLMTETEAGLALYYLRKPDKPAEPVPIKETGAMTGRYAELGKALLGIGPNALRLGQVQDAELATIYRHLENNNFSSPMQLMEAIDAIRDLAQEVEVTQLPLQFIAGISKMLKRVVQRNRDFNDIEALRYLGEHLYELYTESKSEIGGGARGFVRRALEAYRRESPVPGTPVAERAATEPGISVLQRGEPARYRDPLGRPIVNPRIEEQSKILEQVQPGPGRTQAQTAELVNQVLDEYLKDRESSSYFERMISELNAEKVGREALKEIKDEVPRKRGEPRNRWIERVREHYASDVTWESIREGSVTGAEMLQLYRQAAWQSQFGEILESQSAPEEVLGQTWGGTPSGPVRQALQVSSNAASLPFKAVFAGIRWGSEWMVDRLRRVTPAFQLKAQAILANLNFIISRQSLYSGRMLAEFGDEMLKAAGRNTKGVRWMSEVDSIIPFVGGINNATQAIEGRIYVPDEAIEINTMAQEVNLLIGKFMEFVAPGFIANGGMSRQWNAFGYDVMRIGRGQNFENLVNATALANSLPRGTVRAKFKKLSRLLNSPNPDIAQMYRVNQEFIRTMPHAVTHIWSGPKNKILGHWEPVLHADLFDYFNHGIRRAAMIRAFRETYPIRPKDPATGKRVNIPGAADINQDIGTLREAAGSQWNGLINAVYRTLQGHPSENMAQTGFRLPASIADPGGYMLRILTPIGSLMRAFWLTKQPVLQVGELLSGGSSIFFGFRRSMLTTVSTLRHPEHYAMLEYNGTVDRVIYNNSWNRNSPIRASFRIFTNNVQRATQQHLLNELQEAQGAGAAEFTAEKIRDANIPGSGVRLNREERLRVPQAFRAMGFNAREVSDMMRGDPILLAQMVRRAASFSSGGHAHPTESSRLLANRDFQKLFWFQRYPATRTNQFMKIAGLILEHRANHDYKQMAAATYLMVRFGGFVAIQGLIQSMMIAGFSGGLFALYIYKKEWEDEPFAMLVDGFRSAIGGPAQLVTKGYEDAGMFGVANNIKRMSAPYNIMAEMWDLAAGKGLYKDLDVTDRIAAYLNRNIPMARASKTAAAWVGLSTYDSNLEEARKALGRWKRDKFGPGEYRGGDSDNFRIQMKKAVEALKRGDVEGQLDAMAKAVDFKIEAGMPLAEAGQSVRSSFRARQLLKRPDTNADLTPEELDELEARIGTRAMGKLEDFDLMLRHAAGE